MRTFKLYHNFCLILIILNAGKEIIIPNGLDTAGENTQSTIVSYKPTFNLVLLLSNLTSAAATKLKTIYCNNND